MHELWAATRPFAGWFYLAALAFPVLLGGLWRLRQVRGGGVRARELSRHELAYLHGGSRAVVLAAVRRLAETGALVVSGRGLVHAGARGGRRLPDRIDNAIAANADHVFPRALVGPLRPLLRSTARRLENDGLLVPRQDVRRRVRAVVLLQLGVCGVGVALVVVAAVLREPVWGELLFLGCAVPAVVTTLRVTGRGLPVPTRQGQALLVDRGLRPPPRTGLRRFTAVFTVLALVMRTSVPVPGVEDDDPDSWSEGWPDSGDGGGGDGGGGDSGDSGGGSGGGGES